MLRALSLTFPAGSCTAVMGPSGCGKTTLLRVLMGLEKTYTGCSPAFPKKRSAVFRRTDCRTFYSALMNLRLTLPGVKSDALLRELALLGLTEDDARKPAQSLSGGMKRRVALARAMLADSDIVFLDEPFKGLDETTRAGRRIRPQPPERPHAHRRHARRAGGACARLYDPAAGFRRFRRLYATKRLTRSAFCAKIDKLQGPLAQLVRATGS